MMTASDEELKVVFEDEDMCGLLLETGFRKPVQKITSADKCTIVSSLKDYHCLIKVTWQ